MKKNVFPILFLGTFVAGLYGFLSKPIQMALIPQQDVHFPVIAKVTGVVDSPERKVITDALWFSLKTQSDLYLGDWIQTGSASSLSFAFVQGAQVKVFPGSLISLKTVHSKPLILLQQGLVEISSKTPADVYVTSGLKIEKVAVREEVAATVRDRDMGTLETKYKEVPRKSSLSSQPKLTDKNEVIQKKQSESAVSGVVTKTPIKDRPLQYPYPVNQTVFLKKGAGTLRIFPAELCHDVCVLKVLLNQKEVQAIYIPSGQEPQALVSFDESGHGKYTWFYQDGKSMLQGQFIVERFSQENLKKFIDLRQPIEIMSGL